MQGKKGETQHNTVCETLPDISEKKTQFFQNKTQYLVYTTDKILQIR